MPYYISGMLPKTLLENKEIHLATKEVRFNPFTFKLVVLGADLKDRNKKDLLLFEQLTVDFAPIQLLRLDLVCKHVKLESPFLHLTRNNDKSYNWSELFPHLQDNVSDDAMMGFSDLPFLFSLNNIEISRGRIAFIDQPVSKDHRINDITLQLPTFSNMALQVDTYITPVFSANINGSPITLKGDATLGSGSRQVDSTKLSSNIDGVDLSSYWSYLPVDLPLALSSGKASGTIDFTFNNNAEERDKIRVDFNVIVSGFIGNIEKSKLQVESPELQLEGSIAPVQRELHLKKLSFEAPIFSYKGKALTNDLLQMLPHRESDTTSLQPGKQEIAIIIDSLLFKNGVFSRLREGKQKTLQDFDNLDFELQHYSSKLTIDDESYGTSSLTLSGKTVKDDGNFLYSGTLTRNSELQGKYIIQGISAEKILKQLLPNENLTAEGSGALESNLTISKPTPETEADFIYKDIAFVLNGLKLKNPSGTYFSAEHFRSENGQFSKTSIDFGNLSVEQGALTVNVQDPASLFRKFGSRAYTIDTFHFNGRLQIQSADTKVPAFSLQESEIFFSNPNPEDDKKPKITFKGTSKNGGKINSEGTITFSPFSLSLNAEFSELEPNDVQALLPQTTFFEQNHGTLSGSGRLTLPNAAFIGDFTYLNGNLNTQKSPNLNWKQLICEDINYNSVPYHLGIGTVRFTRPQFTVELNDDGRTLAQKIFHRMREELIKSVQNTNKTQQIKISPVDIQEVNITDGGIKITDNRLKPSWQGTMDKIAGSIKDIHFSNTAKESPFSFTGSLDGAAFAWRGSFDPMRENVEESQSFTLSGYPLINLRQQLSTLFDVNIDTATVDLKMETIAEQDVKSVNFLGVLHQLKALSENSNLALTLAMLRDKDNSFSLELKSQASTGNSSKTVFSEFVDDIQTKIVKADLSPLLLARGDYSDLIDNEFIEFTPGEFMLSDNGRNTLNRYGALLIAHPQIKLILSGSVDSLTDKSNLHEQLERYEAKRVERENEKLFYLWTEKRKQYEEQVKQKELEDQAAGNISESDIPTKVLSGFTPLRPEPVRVDEEMLIDLADKRLNIVKNHFMTQLSLDPQRIEIQFPKGINKNANQQPGVEVNIGAL